MKTSVTPVHFSLFCLNKVKFKKTSYDLFDGICRLLNIYILYVIGGEPIRLGEAQASPKQRRRRLREVHLIWKKVVNLIFNVDAIGEISVDFSSILSLLLMKINKMIKKRLLRKGKYDAES